MGPTVRFDLTEYVETWKAIARVIGRSERWCRYMARRPDPLPVFKVGKIVRLNATDLATWIARQRDQSIARAEPLAS